MYVVSISSIYLYELNIHWSNEIQDDLDFWILKSPDNILLPESKHTKYNLDLRTIHPRILKSNFTAFVALDSPEILVSMIPEDAVNRFVNLNKIEINKNLELLVAFFQLQNAGDHLCVMIHRNSSKSFKRIG